MGIFAYDCAACKGTRCANPDCDDANCEGGQFCFEKTVVVYINEHQKYFDAEYTGYGYVNLKTEAGNIPVYLEEFSQFWQSWESRGLKPKRCLTSKIIYCKSCFEKMISKRK